MLLFQYYTREKRGTMKVKEIMRKCRTISGDMSIMEAAQLMNKHHIGSLVVIDEKENYKEIIAGIITERDILEKVTAANKLPSKIFVKDVMTKKVITISPDEYIDDAVYLMIQNKIKKLPVLNDCELVGIITSTDIVANSSEVGEFYMFE